MSGDDLRQRLIELRDYLRNTPGGRPSERDLDTLAKAVNELDRIERVREKIEGPGSLRHLFAEEATPPPFRHYGNKLLDELLSLLNTPPEDSP